MHNAHRKKAKNCFNSETIARSRPMITRIRSEMRQRKKREKKNTKHKLGPQTKLSDLSARAANREKSELRPQLVRFN